MIGQLYLPIYKEVTRVVKKERYGYFPFLNSCKIQFNSYENICFKSFAAFSLLGLRNNWIIDIDISHNFLFQVYVHLFHIFIYQ